MSINLSAFLQWKHQAQHRQVETDASSSVIPNLNVWSKSVPVSSYPSLFFLSFSSLFQNTRRADNCVMTCLDNSVLAFWHTETPPKAQHDRANRVIITCQCQHYQVPTFPWVTCRWVRFILQPTGLAMCSKFIQKYNLAIPRVYTWASQSVHQHGPHLGSVVVLRREGLTRYCFKKEQCNTAQIWDQIFTHAAFYSDLTSWSDTNLMSSSVQKYCLNETWSTFTCGP